MRWGNYSQILFQKIKIENFKLYTVCFDCMLSWGLSKYIKTKLQSTCFCFIKSFLKKNKTGFGTSLPASFSAWILKKNFISLSGRLYFVSH